MGSRVRIPTEDEIKRKIKDYEQYVIKDFFVKRNKDEIKYDKDTQLSQTQ